MEKDERLLPLPKELQQIKNHQDGPANYAPVYDDETFSDKRSYREYFLIIYKRLPLIIALTALVTAAVAFYMYRQPAVYEARTTLVIEPKKPKTLSKSDININFVSDLNYFNTQLKLLQSTDLMKEVVIETGIYRDPNILTTQNKSFFSSLRSIFSGSKEEEPAPTTMPVLSETSTEETTIPTEAALTAEEKRRVDMYSGMLLGNLSVLPEEKTNIVNLRVTGTKPELVTKISDATAEVFIKQNVRREMQGTQKSLEELTKSMEELQANIAQQEQERLNQMRNSGLPLAEKGNELARGILQQKSTEWLNAEADRRKTQQLYETASQAARKGEIYAVAQSQAISSAREMQLRQKAEAEKRIEDIDKQIKDAETERSALLVRYTEDYPKVKEIEAKIKTLNLNKEKIRSEVDAKIQKDSKTLETNTEKETLAGLYAQYQSALKREQQAKSSYFSEVALANQQGQDAARLTTLTQTIDSNRNLLNTYIQRQKEYELAMSASRPDNITISSYAVKPTAPVGPQRNRNIIIAFLVSLAAGIGLAFLIDYLDDSVRTSDDIGRHVGLPTLAMIPHTVGNDKKRNTPALTNGRGNASTALITLEDNRSAMAEAYRHLRTSLLFSSAGKPPQTILVTSSQPSEGKTTTAINTAITLAQSGADVVLIDCDLRRPRLHHHFSLPNMTGLTNYLSGDKNTENLVKTYPGLPKLKVITSGPIPPNPTELLSSNEMKNLLQFLRTNYKHIVIDTPPAISFTDAAIISMLVDGVILVAMAGKSSIHLMRRFKQRLSGIGARIYGVVLNGIKPNSLEYGYYGYGYTYSYYDAPEDDSTPRMEEEKTASIHATKG